MAAPDLGICAVRGCDRPATVQFRHPTLNAAALRPPLRVCEEHSASTDVQFSLAPDRMTLLMKPNGESSPRYPGPPSARR